MCTKAVTDDCKSLFPQRVVQFSWLSHSVSCDKPMHEGLHGVLQKETSEFPGRTIK